jgi:hypothetical protein
MAVIAGDLVTRLGIDGRKFQSGLSKARGETRSFAADVTKIVSGIALYDIGKSAVTSVFGLARETVNLAATAETAAVQFKVLTGSASSAAAVMDEINKFAADTPFESMEITQAAKQLIAFGGSAGTVIGELRTLGDLSAGMGIPLTELAEIYGKARIQGRLFMEDINQLQGRGINISAELAKEFGNVRQAVEKGQVNFGHLERALKAMTSEGGAFAGMMQDMSKTFEGQTSTLLDNIKAIGRDIGEMILPRLTEMVDQSNEVLAAFNALGDARWKFLGDVLVASFDVAMETIKIHWSDMLFDMGKKMEEMLSPKRLTRAWVKGEGLMAMLRPEAAPQDLQEAKNRLNALMGQLNPGQQKQPFQWQGPREQGFAAGILRNMNKTNQVTKPVAEAAKGMFATLQGKLAAGQMGIGGIVDRAKIRGGAMLGSLQNWFDSPDWEKDKSSKQEPQLAGAMAAGSQEAFSTIFAAMLQRGKDPNVQATEKQTRELKKALKDNKPQMMLAMGAVGP